MKILVIEDDEMIRGTLRDILELNDHEVVTAADGAEGIGRVREARPDLILCDIGLPKMDGYKVIESVQALPEGRDIPFIFLTARASREDQRRGMQLGADDYITKPFSEQEILSAIAARVKRQQPLKSRLETLLGERERAARAEWSHELLTPLSGVEGGLSLIESEAENLSPQELRELIAMMRASAERQRRLATKLVAYFRLLQAAPAAVDEEPLEFSGHIVVAAEQAAADAERGADLLVDCEPGQAAIEVEQVALAVRELMENACKFSEKGTPIAVTGRRGARGYTVSVMDQGPGLPAEDCARVGAFVQIGRGRREQQGLGLGIAIARLAAARVGGEVILSPRADPPGLEARLTIAAG